MVTITLEPEQAQRLREVLESYLGELRMQISATDRQELREDLKETKEFLGLLVRRLQMEEEAA